MGFLLVLLVGLVIFIILLFSSKTFSPIPYFPSQKIDLPLIVKALDLKNNLTVFDLGAGDGIVIFEAAKEAFKQKLNTQFIAVEINPILILVLQIRRLFHPNKNNIKIVYDDIFKMKFEIILNEVKDLSRMQDHSNKLRDSSPSAQNDIVFYLYISPWFLEKTISNIKYQISNFKIVSYMYEIKSLKKQEKKIKGKNYIFQYSL